MYANIQFLKNLCDSSADINITKVQLFLRELIKHLFLSLRTNETIIFVLFLSLTKTRLFLSFVYFFLKLKPHLST